MEIFPDIPYTHEAPRNPLHEFDLYLPHASTTDRAMRPLICFVHGGAWRSEDKADHSLLAEKLARQTGFPVVVPNYRLTPREKIENKTLQHPSHAQDILDFLEFLFVWDAPSGPNRAFDPTRLFLMGHSCGAHMLSSIFLDSSSVTPSLTPSDALFGAIRGIIMSEGLYDLDLLITRFPAYQEWFITPTFGDLASYAPFAVTSYPPRSHSIKWFLIHSQGDTIVDFPQSEKMYEHLKSEYGSLAEEHISYDTSSTQDHDGILVTDEFVKIAAQFMEKAL